MTRVAILGTTLGVVVEAQEAPATKVHTAPVQASAGVVIDGSDAESTDQSRLDDWLASAEARDLTGDGTIDIADLEDYLELRRGTPVAVDPVVPGVEPQMTLALEQWLAIYSTEDLNSDGRVDDLDYGLWLANPFFGDLMPGTSSQATPL